MLMLHLDTFIPDHANYTDNQSSPVIVPVDSITLIYSPDREKADFTKQHTKVLAGPSGGHNVSSAMDVRYSFDDWAAFFEARAQGQFGDIGVLALTDWLEEGRGPQST